MGSPSIDALMSKCEKIQLHHAGDELLKLDGIDGEVANAFGQLLGSHGVLVHHPSESLFVHLNAGDIGAGGGSRIKHPAKAVTTRKARENRWRMSCGVRWLLRGTHNGLRAARALQPGQCWP